jgi:hypothetical protein
MFNIWLIPFTAKFLYKISNMTKLMDSKQIFMLAAIVAAFSVAIVATPVLAQNMTGGNMTGGGNVTGGNMTTGGNATTATTAGPVTTEGGGDDDGGDDDGDNDNEDRDDNGEGGSSGG